MIRNLVRKSHGLTHWLVTGGPAVIWVSLNFKSLAATLCAARFNVQEFYTEITVTSCVLCASKYVEECSVTYVLMKIKRILQ